FDIDANGIVHVSAKDKATSKEQKITITANSGLSEDEIKRMVDDAKAHEEDDKKRKEAVENKNALEAMVIQTKKLLEENGDKLPADAKGEVEAAITEAEAAVESGDADRITAAREKLTQASHKLAQAMYGQGQQQQQEQQPPGGPQQQASDDSDDGDVIDAEFEEKN
ncbi:MAG: Hsp70 family protein, partial [Myxococcales bacterium]|nr:Hsp70 family protein [Myxococcales bacterium]